MVSRRAFCLCTVTWVFRPTYNREAATAKTKPYQIQDSITSATMARPVRDLLLQIPTGTLAASVCPVSLRRASLLCGRPVAVMARRLPAMRQSCKSEV